jgi:hypothetical protein
MIISNLMNEQLHAPVLIPTLNRYSHFIKCVESLSKCDGAEFTPLYIALDFPKSVAHEEGFSQILNYLPTINGFHSVTIIRRTTNLGAVKNLFEAIHEIFQSHDRLILSEDDNVFSSDFLSFVNAGLNSYRDRPDIFSISGYMYPVKEDLSKNVTGFLWTGFSAWGTGIWKEKWNKIDFEENHVMKTINGFLRKIHQVHKFNKVANHYVPALIFMYRHKVVHADGFVCLHLFIHHQYTLFPSTTRVQNHGNDGSGENCVRQENDIFINQQLYSGPSTKMLPIDIKWLPINNKVMAAYFRKKFKNRVKTLFTIIFLRFR